jgi:hypothetical protein
MRLFVSNQDGSTTTLNSCTGAKSLSFRDIFSSSREVGEGYGPRSRLYRSSCARQRSLKIGKVLIHSEDLSLNINFPALFGHSIPTEGCATDANPLEETRVYTAELLRSQPACVCIGGCHSVTQSEMCALLHGNIFLQCLRCRLGPPAVDSQLGEQKCRLLKPRSVHTPFVRA